jgi:tetratricopeptide (TPR) repeat protein
VPKVLAQTPKGFKQYVKQQFQQLARLEEIKRHPEVQELFAMLCVALGVLSEDDIQELTNLNVWDLAALPWQATRWFSIKTGLYSFAHPLLADEFQCVLGRQASSAEGKLIKYCSRWQEHQSRYALRHYSEHLRDVKEWEKLYANARDEDFASAQQQQLPDEPDLPLKTVQIALLGAADTDDAGVMAEFVLFHAQRLLKTTAQESPLEALRKGSLERALKLADLYEVERCSLWYLLLAWELKDTGRLDEARETLKKLQKKELPRFQMHWSTQWQRDYAKYLLPHIFEVSKETCIALHKKFFEDPNLAFLVYCLIEHGDLKAALEITRKTFPSWCWVLRMGQIAKAQMEVGQREEAIATFAEAIETVHKIENPKDRLNTLIGIANSQADVGLFSDARETLQHIDIQGASKNSWISLAKVQAKIGDKKQAITSLNQAKQLARNIEDKNHSSLILSEIASKQAEIGEFTEALETIEELASLEPHYVEGLFLGIVNKEECDEKDFINVLATANRIAEKIDIPYYQEQVLKAIVAVQATKAQRWKEDFAEALTTTRRIKDKSCKVEALLIIVNAQIKLRWFDQGLVTVEIIDSQEDKDQALVAILKEQATAGQFEEAFTTGSQIQKPSKQEDALVEIAKAYAQAKNFSHAINIANGLFNPYKKVELLKSIATIQSQACLAKEARDTLAMGLNVSFSSELSYEQAFGCINVAKLLIQTHQNQKSLSYLKNADEISKNISDIKDKVSVLAVLGELYAKAGQRNKAKDRFTEAIEIVQTVEKQNSPNHIDGFIVLFRKIGVAQARAREFDAALETVEKIKLIGHKAQVLKTLAQEHPDAEQTEILKIAIATVYKDALSSFNSEFDHSATILSSIAVAQMALGEREAALAIFAEAFEIIKEEKSQTFKTNPDSLLSTVVAAQAESGYFDRALKSAEKIEDEWEQVKALSKIASFQWKQGDKEGLSTTLDIALMAKEKITDGQKRLLALWVIAQIQSMAGKVEQAVRTAKQVLTNHNQLLCDIATNLSQLKDKDNFKKLLIPCAYSFDTAYKMCGYLARLYPQQASAVAKVVTGSINNIS